MAMFTVQDDATVEAAHRRLRARAAALRGDWHNVRASCRNALTHPAMIAGAAMAGAMMASRARLRRAPVECKCASAKPSLLRLSLLALVTPLLQEAMAIALANLVAGGGDRSQASAPSSSVGTSVPPRRGA